MWSFLFSFVWDYKNTLIYICIGFGCVALISFFFLWRLEKQENDVLRSSVEIQQNIIADMEKREVELDKILVTREQELEKAQANRGILLNEIAKAKGNKDFSDWYDVPLPVDALRLLSKDTGRRATEDSSPYAFGY